MELILNQVSARLGGQAVLDGITATFAPGKLYVVVGPNGAGKSTLLKTIAALLPLSFGNISLNGESIPHLPPARRAEQIAYLPQERSIAWDLSCVEIAALGATHLLPEVARQAALAELQALGLGAMAGRGVFALSGGQRARVLLARVLVSPAKVWLLDEPLIALDPAWQRQVLLRLKQRAQAGQTVVLSLHDLHLAAAFADEILLLNDGLLVTMGKPEKVFTAKYLRDVFQLTGGMDGRDLKLEAQPLI
jgi:iron complex transport system ATP-binding protein